LPEVGERNKAESDVESAEEVVLASIVPKSNDAGVVVAVGPGFTIFTV
jgi:hypothetical protein